MVLDQRCKRSVVVVLLFILALLLRVQRSEVKKVNLELPDLVICAFILLLLRQLLDSQQTVCGTGETFTIAFGRWWPRRCFIIKSSVQGTGRP